MEWLIPVLGLVVLAVFIINYLTKKNKPKQVTGVMLFAIALFIYHLGDAAMWAFSMDSQWYYELSRRVASLGYYLEIPALLLLTMWCIPQETKTKFIKLFSWVLVIPWVIAILLIINMPNNFLMPPNIPVDWDPGVHMNLIYTLILFYLISVVYVFILTIKGAKLLEGAAKGLCKIVGIASLIQLIAYLVIFSFSESYDATYLFGIISIIWIVLVGLKANALLKETAK